MPERQSSSADLNAVGWPSLRRSARPTSHALCEEAMSAPNAVCALRRVPQACHSTRAELGLTLLFIVSRVVILVSLAGRTTDLGTQREYAVKMAGGQVPFRDFFPEYPPLVFLYTGISALVDPSLDRYFPIFRALTCAVDCGIWIVLLRACGAVWRPATTAVSPVARDGSAEKKIATSQQLLYIVGTTALGA